MGAWLPRLLALLVLALPFAPVGAAAPPARPSAAEFSHWDGLEANCPSLEQFLHRLTSRSRSRERTFRRNLRASWGLCVK